MESVENGGGDVQVLPDTQVAPREDSKSVTSVNSLDEGGPWGLVIIISAFMIQVFAFGTGCSIGVYNVEFLNYFNNDVTGVSLMTSINIAFFMGGGLLANWLASKYSHRAVALLGAALMAVGLFVMPWLQSLRAMIPFYGVFVGLGGCFAYAPSHTLSGLYYNKYRSLATGLATSGSGLGTAVFPPLISFLIEEYSWKGSLIFLAGLNLHIFIFAMLLRPPPPQPPVEDSASTEQDNTPQKLTKAQRIKQEYCLCCDLGFNVYFVSNVLWNAGAAIYIAFGPEFFRSVGHSKMEASLMLTLFGLGEFVGGIVGGIVGNIPSLNRLAIYVGACSVGGAMVFLFPVSHSLALTGVLSFFFGICFGILLGLLIIVMTDLIGTDKIGIGLGFILLADGIGAFMGPPIAGVFQDTFGTYEQALYFSGIVTLTAGVIIALIPLHQRMCNEDEVKAGATDTPPPSTPSLKKYVERKRLSDVAVERGRRSLSVKSSGASLKSMEGDTSPSRNRKYVVARMNSGNDENSMPQSDQQPVKFYCNNVVELQEVDLHPAESGPVPVTKPHDVGPVADTTVQGSGGMYQAVPTEGSGSPEHKASWDEKKDSDVVFHDNDLIMSKESGKISVRF
ncbi:monocarboxylate transporter 13 [Aplysia californica]|uniref:Monocarboxylate transporter 13 n=1 Tax=Aplysia californica TaxID=6500 RepID=A0ABM0JRI7_APLCA|nr:monocarboxylate transporter 13 [Aplysia californica]